MILIGSRALNYFLSFGLTLTPRDYDLVATYQEAMAFVKKLSVKPDACYPIDNGKKLIVKAGGNIFEFELAWEGSTAEKLIELVENDHLTTQSLFENVLVPSLNVLYMLKMSHRYLKNSPAFNKTMDHIHLMRSLGAKITPELQEFYKLREEETYSYSHPKLNVTKNDFFKGDGVKYVFEHDDIHEAIKFLDRPAYTYFKPNDQEVFCSKDMFFALDAKTRNIAVLEEACVLALERSQIHFWDKITEEESFDIALMKVCTSITSGWFREYAWENYYQVKELFDDFGYKYADKFWEAVGLDKVKLYNKKE